VGGTGCLFARGLVVVVGSFLTGCAGGIAVSVGGVGVHGFCKLVCCLEGGVALAD